MFLDLDVVDSQLTLIICIIDVFTLLKALWRKAWEHTGGHEEPLIKEVGRCCCQTVADWESRCCNMLSSGHLRYSYCFNQ